MTKGQLVMKDQVAYTPWLPRGQFDAALLEFNLIDQTTYGTLSASLWHRDSEDTDHGTILGSAATVSSGATITTKEGLKEFFRLKFEGGGDSAADWSLIDVYQPVLYSKKR